jgi:predicted negative regulator of RcsB-dependent stress response
MSVYQTEEEQVEAIKGWWKQNGKAVITGLILGGAILAGTKLWVGHQQQQEAAASTQYQIVVNGLENDKPDQVLEHGAVLVDQYSGTPYAALAALAMAKVKVDQGKMEAAETHLRWVIDHAKQTDMKRVATLRLAKLQFAQGKGNAALTLLGATDPGTFKAPYEELKGDIYTQQGHTDQARSAYQAAMAAMPERADRTYLKMKLENLGAKDAS